MSDSISSGSLLTFVPVPKKKKKCTLQEIIIFGDKAVSVSPVLEKLRDLGLECSLMRDHLGITETINICQGVVVKLLAHCRPQ